MVEKSVKLILSVLLFLCLLDMPYGYYQLVRFLALAVFGYLSFISFANKDERLGLTYAALAVLFQPIIKISLGRELWNAVDVIVGTGLILSLVIKAKTTANK